MPAWPARLMWYRQAFATASASRALTAFMMSRSSDRLSVSPAGLSEGKRPQVGDPCVQACGHLAQLIVAGAAEQHVVEGVLGGQGAYAKPV